MNPSGQLFSPFDDLIGSEVVSVSGAKVVATIDISERHHQVSGIAHGGVYASLIESVTSIGATFWLAERERAAGTAVPPGDVYAVGVSNHTDFIKATTEGVLTFTATPIQQGRRLQTWVVRATNADGDLVAHGNVKLMNRQRHRGPVAGEG